MICYGSIVIQFTGCFLTWLVSHIPTEGPKISLNLSHLHQNLYLPVSCHLQRNQPTKLMIIPHRHVQAKPVLSSVVQVTTAGLCSLRKHLHLQPCKPETPTKQHLLGNPPHRPKDLYSDCQGRVVVPHTLNPRNS